jgi:hypothetical protein
MFKPVNNSIRTADLHSSWFVTDKDSNHSTEGADLNLHRFKRVDGSESPSSTAIKNMGKISGDLVNEISKSMHVPVSDREYRELMAACDMNGSAYLEQDFDCGRLTCEYSEPDEPDPRFDYDSLQFGSERKAKVSERALCIMSGHIMNKPVVYEEVVEKMCEWSKADKDRVEAVLRPIRDQCEWSVFMTFYKFIKLNGRELEPNLCRIFAPMWINACGDDYLSNVESLFSCMHRAIRIYKRMDGGRMQLTKRRKQKKRKGTRMRRRSKRMRL